jgi:hypothetical protein
VPGLYVDRNKIADVKITWIVIDGTLESPDGKQAKHDTGFTMVSDMKKDNFWEYKEKV